MSRMRTARGHVLDILGAGALSIMVAVTPVAPAAAIEQVDAAPTVDHYNDPAFWLEERADVMSWSRLATPRVEVSVETGPEVTFGADLEAMDGTLVRMQGFVFPLDQALEQRHFLLSALPPSCPFCMPGGPDSMVEIEAAEPVPFTYDPVIVSGTLALVRDGDYGLWYRLTEARPVELN